MPRVGHGIPKRPGPLHFLNGCENLQCCSRSTSASTSPENSPWLIRLSHSATLVADYRVEPIRSILFREMACGPGLWGRNFSKNTLSGQWGPHLIHYSTPRTLGTSFDTARALGPHLIHFRGGPGLAPAKALARAWLWAWFLVILLRS